MMTKTIALAFLPIMLAARVASAEAGVPLDATAPADDAACADDGCSDAGVPVACDGALCDTTNSATCDVGPGGTPAVASLALLSFAAIVACARRVRRKTKESR